MPSDDRPIVIDSNVLVFASSPASEFHEAALDAIDRVDRDEFPAWISSQILREYLVHMTRPDVLGTRPHANVIAQVEKLRGHFSSQTIRIA